MHIRSMHNKRVYIHPLFTLPGQRLYISGECARLCLHRRESSPLREKLRRRRACLTLFFSFFLETRGILLDRDDFFAALGAYYSGHVPPEASLIEFSSEPRQPNLVFSEFFLVWGGGYSVECSISKGENSGRVCLSRRIKILLGDRDAFLFKFRSIKKRKFY